MVSDDFASEYSENISNHDLDVTQNNWTSRYTRLASFESRFTRNPILRPILNSKSWAN